MHLGNTELTAGLTIGPARAGEMDAICAIARAAWEPIHDAMVDDLGDDLHDRLSGDWRARKEAQVRRQYETNPAWVLAVRDGDRVAGFVTYRIDRDRSIGEIGNNALDAAYQGRGIATAMYGHVLGVFRDEGLAYAAVSTGLDAGHAPARRAYERAGFDLRRESVTYFKRLTQGT